MREWFGVLPIPEHIEGDNGSHFTATMVQDWARGQGVKWVFNTARYPQVYEA